MTKGIVEPIVDVLAKWGFSPNLLTVAGLLANMAAALLLGRGELVWAGVVLLVLGPLDGLDGALARRLNQSSKTGAFLDSNFDRLSEIAVYLGLLWHYQELDYQAGVILAYLTITGSLMVSYARARAEALGAECQIGLMTRMERFLVLLVGLFTGYMTVALVALAALTYVTVLQRIWHTRKELKKDKS
jgi:CDP-diacylglycerol--glycerol-3-phosphate 3-phosphatidyltransferase